MTAGDIKRARILISGRVQGVYYRATAREVARSLGLKGWVRNLPDGRVEALAEGPSEKLEKFIQWCWQGPPAARVTNVDVKWEEPRGDLPEFTVKYSF